MNKPTPQRPKEKKSRKDILNTEGYSLTELQELLSEASGKDQSGFFKNYIQGVERIPLDYYLNMGGFVAKEENGMILISLKEEANSSEKQITNGLFGIK